MVGTITEDNRDDIVAVYGEDIWQACEQADEKTTFLQILIQEGKL